MNNRNLISLFVLLFIVASCTQKTSIQEFILSEHWQIRSSDGLNADGVTLSSTVHSDGKWVDATVPSTVLGALCNAGVYKDPFFGMNLEKIPVEPFEMPWWYVTSFDMPSFSKDKEQVRLFRLTTTWEYIARYG